MKITKKIIALTMATIMLVLPCIPADASATATLYRVTGHTVEDGVEYSKYTVKGSQSGHTELTTILEFNPANGYIPMAFAASAGNANLLEEQYSTAVNKYGYEVAGVINGSYFDMTYGTLNGMLISGGKICCADIGGTYGNVTNVVAFGYDGSMNIVDTQLEYKLYVNNELIPDALRFFNKQQGVDDWAEGAKRIFYYDTSCGTKADSIGGYEVVCEKLNGTDLAVGETMVGKVVEVKSYASGSSIASNQFVLSTKSGAEYETYLANLSVGDTIEISVNERIAESAEIMENAASVITNVGFLVKDGVDMTDYNSVIGDHSVTDTYARWTAFGQKPDGTYVFFTSEGGDTGVTSRSLTLKDVAAAMMQLGCTNVIRLDGGGSTGMYVSNTGSGNPGYVTSSGREVADCILIVKSNATNKPILKSAIKAAEKISYTDYTEKTLVDIRAAYEEAKAVYYNANSTDADYAAAAEKLNALVANAGPSSMVNGDQFWLTHYNTQDNGGAGVIITESTSYTLGNWWYHAAFAPVEGTSAYEITNISNGLGGTGTVLDIPEGGFVYALNKGNAPYNSAAVNAMAERVSEWSIGDQFIFTGLDLTGNTVPTTTPLVDWYDSSYNCTAKIAPYDPNAEDDRVSNGIYITDFNTSILAGDATIFTSDFNGDGLITGKTANHLWTYNVVLTWNSSIGAYVVTSSSAGGGVAPDIQLTKDMILIAIHNGGGTSATNYNTLSNAKVGQVLNTYGIDIASRDIGDVASYLTLTDMETILYQKKDDRDLRLVAYLDDYTAYSSVSFSLTLEDGSNGSYKFKTAYGQIYVNGVLRSTEDVYGKEGYFVTCAIENYLTKCRGEQATITVYYEKLTGETLEETRTIVVK